MQVLGERWQKHEFHDKVSAFTDDETPKSPGDGCFSIQSTGPNDAYWAQTVPVQPNTLYELSGWIRTEGVDVSAEEHDGGANLCVIDTWWHTVPVLGSSGWVFRTLRFDSGARTEVTIGARLGFWKGVTQGQAWFSGVRLSKADEVGELPRRWTIQALVYQQTNALVTNESGSTARAVCALDDDRLEEIVRRLERFVEEELPALTAGALSPELRVDVVRSDLSTLSTSSHGGWWPALKDTVEARSDEVDSVIVVWPARPPDLVLGELAPTWGLTQPTANRQTYATVTAERLLETPFNDVLMHEFGHSVLYYFDALGRTGGLGTNDLQIAEYFDMESGMRFDEKPTWHSDMEPDPTYELDHGFTHAYMSGSLALSSNPTQRLGISSACWRLGGPVTYRQD